jgi:hypothetical protein
MSLYRTMIKEFQNDKSPSEVYKILSKDNDFSFLFADEAAMDAVKTEGGTRFKRETKGAAYLRDAIPTAPRCHTCGGLLHRNGMQTGHQKHKRDGGCGELSNAIMQHPFCNSTVNQ